jgi:preprotein translocase subunit YajC
MKPLFVFAIFVFSLCAFAQEPPAAAPPAALPQGGAREGGPREGQRGSGGGGMFTRGGTAGTITEVKDDVVKLKTDAGKSVTVKTTANTRIFGKERTPLTLKDLKVGDVVMAAGPPAGEDTIDARLVALLDEAAVKRMKEMQANLGKTNIAGEVKAIDETKITVLRPDGQTQVIEVDENTSLKKQNESVTLADIKPGEFINGPGELKNGVFVAKELRVMAPRQRSVEGEIRKQPEKQ